jgi:hypothetical protein
MGPFITWLYVHAGLQSGNSPWYLFPSGIGSIIIPPLITLAGVAALWWWHHQCAVHRCYWPARRLTAAGERACFRHHPHPKRSAEDVHEAHHAVLRLRHREHPPPKESPP